MASFDNEHQKIIKALGIGLIAAVVCAAALTCIIALALQMTAEIPREILDYIMIGTEGISVLSGAYIAGAVSKSKGILIGTCCAAAVFLLLTACGMSIADNDIGLLTLIRAAVLLLCGIIGGIAGVNRKEKVRIK